MTKHISVDRRSNFMATKVIKFDCSRTMCIKDTPDVIMFPFTKVNYMGIPKPDRRYQTIEFCKPEVHGTGSWQRCKTCGISNLIPSMGLAYYNYMLIFMGYELVNFESSHGCYGNAMAGSTNSQKSAATSCNQLLRRDCDYVRRNKPKML